MHADSLKLDPTEGQGFESLPGCQRLAPQCRAFD